MTMILALIILTISFISSTTQINILNCELQNVRNIFLKHFI